MAREATITQEQVNAAADALRADGVKPTVRAVRERLGTGSNATVMRLLDIWKGGQVKPPAETPLTLLGSLRSLVDDIEKAAATDKAGQTAELAELQQTNADLVTESERQTAVIADLEVERDAVKSERDALVGRVEQLEEIQAKLRDEVEQERHAAEGARTELAKALLRLEAMPRLEADLAAVRVELDRERAGRVVAEQAAAVAEAKREAEVAARVHVEAELAKVEKDLTVQRKYGQDLSDSFHKQQGATYEVNAKLSTAEYQLRHTQSELDAVRSELDAVRALRAVPVAPAGEEAAAPAEKPAGTKKR